MRFFLPAEVDLAGTQLCSRTRYGTSRALGVCGSVWLRGPCLKTS
jgi:hypothetical protein